MKNKINLLMTIGTIFLLIISTYSTVISVPDRSIDVDLRDPEEPNTSDKDGSGDDPCDRDETKPEAGSVSEDQPPDDSDDDELGSSRPHPSGSTPGGSDDGLNIVRNIGDALHVQPTTGNVNTELPICSGFTLRYSSLKTQVQTIFGYGWTHSNNIYLDETPEDGVIIVDGYGKISKYTGDKDTGFESPPLRKSTLYFEDNIYVLYYFDGSVIEFHEYQSEQDGNYYIKRFINPHGQITDFSYGVRRIDDIYHTMKLTTIQTNLGQKIKLYYTNDLVTSVEKVGWKGKTEFVYSDDQELISVHDPINGITTYDYADNHELIFEQLKNGISYTATYINRDDGPDERILYDSLGNVVYHVISEEGFPQERPVTCIPGIVVLIDGNEKTWLLTRNANGQLVEMESPDGYTTTYEYYPIGHQNEAMMGQVTNPREFSKYYTYDEYHNLRFFFNQKGDLIEYQYNDDHLTPSGRRKFPALLTAKIQGNGESPIIWSYQYTDHGRLSQITDPTGNVTIIAYDYYDIYERNLKSITKTDRNNHITRTEFTQTGRISTYIVDPDDLELTVSYSYDYYRVNPFDPFYQFWLPDGGIFGSILFSSVETQIEREPGDIVKVKEVYDNNNQLVQSIIDPDDLQISTRYFYDELGNIKYVSNPKEVITAYEYDHRGRIQKIITDNNGPNQAEIEIDYDGNSNMKTFTDSMGNITTFYYDDSNRLLAERDPENYLTFYDRDENGNVKNVTQTLNPSSLDRLYKVHFEYDELDRVIKTVTDPNDKALETTIAYVEDLGGCGCGGSSSDLIASVTDAEGKKAYMYYDALEQVRTVVGKINDTDDNFGDEDDIILSYDYDAEGNIIQLVGPEGETKDLYYDAANRLFKTISRNPDDQDLETIYDYDDASNLITVTMPNGNIISTIYDGANRPIEINDLISLISKKVYDKNSNIEEIVDALNRTYSFSYDTLDRIQHVIDPGGNQTAYQYDANGNVILSYDKNGIPTKFEYNALGWNTKTIQDYQGELETEVSVEYNGLGLIESINDGLGNPTKYIYDSVLNLEEIRYADDLEGTGDDHILYDFDNVGNLKFKTDQNGYTTEYFYDDAYRLIEKKYPAKGDIPAYSDLYQYDKSSRIIQGKNPYAITNFDYDDLGRVNYEEKIITDLSGIYRTTYEYEIGEESYVFVTYPGEEGRVVTYSSDLRGRPTEIISDGVYTSWIYNDANQMINALFGDAVDPVVRSTFNYDEVGRIKQIIHESEELIYGDEYGYDPNGNRIYTKKLHDPINSERYFYDSLNRLTRLERGELDLSIPENPQISTFTSSPYLRQVRDWSLDFNGNWLHVEQWKTGIFSEETRIPNDVNEYASISC